MLPTVWKSVVKFNPTRSISKKSRQLRWLLSFRRSSVKKSLRSDSRSRSCQSRAAGRPTSKCFSRVIAPVLKLMLILAAAVFWGAAPAQLEIVPAFDIRAHVISTGGGKPGPRKFALGFLVVLLNGQLVMPATPQ